MGAMGLESLCACTKISSFFGPDWAKKAKKYIADAITSAVSPRLAGRVEHALPLALVIMFVTLFSVIGLVFALRNQFVETCASLPIAALDSLEDPEPSCRAFASTNFVGSTYSKSANAAAQVPPATSAWLNTIAYSSVATFGKFTRCSYFPLPCQLSELGLWLYGLVDVSHRMQNPNLTTPNGTNLNQSLHMQNPAGSIGDLWNSGKILTDSLASMSRSGLPISNMAAVIQNAVKLQAPPDDHPSNTLVRSWFRNSSVVKFMPAPPGAGCCDVRLEKNLDSPGRYAMRFTSSNLPDFHAGTCPDKDLRCSTISLSVETDFTCWTTLDPAAGQDYAGSACSGQNRLDFSFDYSISIGSWESVNLNNSAIWQAFIYRLDKGFYDAAARRPANATAGGWAAFGADVPAVFEQHGADVAAWVALFPATWASGIRVTSFVAAGQLTSEQIAETLSQLRLDYYGWVTGWWEQTNIYCCAKSQPTYLSAIGNALGYAGLVEVAIAFVCICIYMLCFPEERKRFGELFQMMTFTAVDRLLVGDAEDPQGKKGGGSASMQGRGAEVQLMLLGEEEDAQGKNRDSSASVRATEAEVEIKLQDSLHRTSDRLHVDCGLQSTGSMTRPLCH